MFFLIGISSKVRECGTAHSGACLVCGRVGALHICTKYMTPHVFFIPTFRFRSTYLATCGACASVMELRAQKGCALEKGHPVKIFPEDLQLLQNNAAPRCPHCGQHLPADAAFCPRCGQRL